LNQNNSEASTVEICRAVVDSCAMMRMKSWIRMFLGTALLFGCAGALSAQSRWVASWATSPQLVDDESALKANELREGTLRQIVHLSIGGMQVRVRLSNRYGTEPLRFAAVHVATAMAAGSAKIVTKTDRELRFSGKPDVIVPAGADYISDAADLPVAALSDLAITLRVDFAARAQTGHPGSRATSFLAKGNNLVAEDLPEAKKVQRWYFVAGVDVAAPAEAFAVVALGDSITDGHGAATDGNNRWPDVLAKRLQTAAAATQKIGVVNQGIGGNRLLLDSIGTNALARFDHDVLAQAGVRCVIVLEGINDLGMLTREKEVSEAEHEREVRRVTGAYEQIIARAHAQGIKVVGATMTPFVGSAFYHPGPKNEADRQAVNAWIRTHFDGVIDFDKVVRDPAHPELMLPEFDSGGHLHPSPAGYAAMAEAIPVSLFVN
jgi:lysophospholipase L1-like esterase